MGPRRAPATGSPPAATTPPCSRSGGEVRNRHTWTVISVHRNGDLTVTDPDRGSVRLPAGYVARHVELGWATTGYGNQGITVDAGIAVVEHSATRAGIYVAMTRGRHGNFAWIPDPTGRADAAEAFGEAIARPANAATAHATRDRLHRQAVLEPPTRRPVPPAYTDPAQQMRARLGALPASPPQGDRSVAEGAARDCAAFSGLVGRQNRAGGHRHGYRHRHRTQAAHGPADRR